MTLFAETRSKWKLLMYKVLRKFNTLQVFFFTKAFGYVQIFIALQKFDQENSHPHNCMICLSSAGIFSKVFYYVCYSICKMYDTCSMFTMIFTFLWNSVLITTAFAAMI